MSMIHLNKKTDLSSTPIPNAFIDSYMSSANATFIVVYIFFYRHWTSGTQEVAIADAAELLNILESDVMNGLRYWERQGLLQLVEDQGQFAMVFLEIPNFQSQHRSPVHQEERKTGEPVVAVPEKPLKTVILESRPQYDVQELEIYKNQSKEINHLFSTAEQVLGKLLTYNDLSALFGMHDWLRLPLDVIEVLLTYCAENNHRSMRYIEKAAIDWVENGIHTVEDANEYIKLFNNDYRDILKAFGHTRRNPTVSEINYMKRWLKDFAMPMNLILEACDKTVMQIGQPKFSYADKILTEWHDKGVKDIDDVKHLEDTFHKGKQMLDSGAKPEDKKTYAVAKPNRFVNFKQRDWDYDKIEKMERQYIENSLK